MANQRASPAGEAIFLENSDFEPGVCESGSCCYTTSASALPVSASNFPPDYRVHVANQQQWQYFGVFVFPSQTAGQVYVGYAIKRHVRGQNQCQTGLDVYGTILSLGPD